MTHGIVKVENYLLVVDDSKIKDGDWMHRNDEQPTFVTPNFLWDFKDRYRKIITHLPLNNAPFLEGVDVLPPLDNIRYDFAEMFYNILKETYPTFYKWPKAIKYKKNREKYEYTKEDILGAMEIGFELGRNFDDDNPNIGLERLVHQKDSYIQYLSQPKMPIGFECAMEYKFPSGREYVQPNPDYLPKTTTNNLGQTQWVGKYIYA